MPPSLPFPSCTSPHANRKTPDDGTVVKTAPLKQGFRGRIRRFDAGADPESPSPRPMLDFFCHPIGVLSKSVL